MGNNISTDLSVLMKNNKQSYHDFLTENENCLKFFTHKEFNNCQYFLYCCKEVLQRKASTTILGLKSFAITNTEFNQIIENIKKKDDLETEKRNRRELYKEARSLENIDNLKAIEIYQSLQSDANFDSLDRLIILYRKTDQRDKEIQAIEWLIEQEHHIEYNRMEYLAIRTPEDEEVIRMCYNKKEVYINTCGQRINFFKKIERLSERLRKLKTNLL